MLDEVRARLNRVMRGFGPAESSVAGFARSSGTPSWRFSVSRESLPLSPVVKLIYVVLGCHGLGRSEKLDWEFVFQVEGTTCSIASEKFGLRVYVDRTSVVEEAEAERLFQRILQATVKGQTVVEKEVLEPIGKELVSAGDVVIGNQYHRLREAYRYFRDGAEIAFRGDGRVEVQTDADGASNIVVDALAAWRRQANADAEGWWNKFACFSALRIDVDPLVVAGRVGEQVHLSLGDLMPFGCPHRCAREGEQIRLVLDTRRHRRPPFSGARA
ncbi:hypothetical protein SAMN04489733_8000 [Amycolatopsis keratiniphila]|nr:hypothetical protein SAMN04489733_8000 [Amycolatopsis keratiniphila]